MRIVCLAWGSLVWKRGALPVAGEWQPGGPLLPIEFARVGEHGELATAITPGHPAQAVRWAALAETDLETACALLRRREGIERDEDLGRLVVAGSAAADPVTAAVDRWARASTGVDAVIWTGLPPRFAGVTGRVPGPQEAVDYLLGLTGHERRHAEEYVRRVPDEIRTRNRSALEASMSAPS